MVHGIRSDRICLAGLITGVTERETWISLLGEPDSSISLAGDDAEAWRLCDGISDYYDLDGARLRLHSDADGVLTTVFLMK